MSESLSASRIRDPFVVVSDIHLKNLQDERGQLLLDLVKRLDTDRVEYFVLLGDIFDFGLGSHRYFRKKFAPLGEALSALAAKGVQVLFFEGNHEFAIDEMPWPGVQFVTQEDKIITLNNGVTIAMCHGDLMAADRSYLGFRSFVKAKAVTTASAYIPGVMLDAYAMTHSSLSRLRHEYSDKVHERVVRGVEIWAEKATADQYLFGHFHIPYMERRADGTTFVSVNSWDKPNVLLMDIEKTWQRVFLKKAGEPFQIQTAKSIL